MTTEANNMDRFTAADASSRMRAKVRGLTTDDLVRLVNIANCAMGHAAAFGPAFLVYLDRSPSELIAMSIGMDMPSLVAAGTAGIRSAIARLKDDQLAWIAWTVSAAINEVAPSPAILLKVAKCSEPQLEEWSFDAGLDGILVNDLVYAARLVLGHFPDGLSADGSDAPPIVIDAERPAG